MTALQFCGFTQEPRLFVGVLAIDFRGSKERFIETLCRKLDVSEYRSYGSFPFANHYNESTKQVVRRRCQRRIDTVFGARSTSSSVYRTIRASAMQTVREKLQ